jgi:hypothetical protein
MINDVVLLKAQNKKLSEEVKSMKANIADLHIPWALSYEVIRYATQFPPRNWLSPVISNRR